MSLPFLHSPAEIVRALLIDLGLGTDPSSNTDWPVYATGEPDGRGVVDAVLTVYDTTPTQDGRSMPDGEQVYHYGFQVRVRAADHPTGFVKASAIRLALNETVRRNTVTISTQRYLVHAASGVNLLTLGKDTPATKRSLFTVNGMVSITRKA
jgi:hypothetical protein